MSNNMVRLKNGVTFHGVSTPFYPRGERHDYASAIVFPDGTKVRGYRYDFGLIDGDEGAKILTGSIETQANGRKVGTKFTADLIEYHIECRREAHGRLRTGRIFEGSAGPRSAHAGLRRCIS
jgi:hypothetical protein